MRPAGRRLLGHGVHCPQAAARILPLGTRDRPLPGLRAGRFHRRGAADEAHCAQAHARGLPCTATPGLHRQPAVLRAAGVWRTACRRGPHLADHRHPAHLRHHHGPARPWRRAAVAPDLAVAGGGRRHRLHQYRPVLRRRARAWRCRGRGGAQRLATPGRRDVRGRRAGVLDALRGR